MARRSRGPPSHAIKISHGPDRAPLNFYSTQYSTTHHNGGVGGTSGGGGGGERRRPFSADTKPQADGLRTRGTGYSANFRPTIYYTSNLDLNDNPPMLKVLADNYTTLTSQHFKGSFRQHRGERRKSLTLPSSHSEGQHIPALDSRLLLRPLTAYPKSETKSTFIAKPFTHSELESSHHSCREETGFTHAQNIEPITFRPPQTFADLSPLSLWQPSSRSVMKRDFIRHYQNTADKDQKVVHGSDRSNGYVKGSNHPSSVQPRGKEMVGYTYTHQLPPSLLKLTSRQDPAHFSTIVHPQHYSSYTHHTLEAGRREDNGSSGEEVTGRKELSGYAENHHPLPRPPSSTTPSFSTHYISQFPRQPIHTTPVGGVASRDPGPNGFCMGTQVHGFTDSQKYVPLHSMHPSLARLVMKKDPACYQDHTHSAKLHSTKKTRP